MENNQFKDLMDMLIGYAFVGQAAMVGMFLSGFLIILNFVGLGIAQPLIGFIVVPIACVWVGATGIIKHKRGASKDGE